MKVHFSGAFINDVTQLGGRVLSFFVTGYDKERGGIPFLEVTIAILLLLYKKGMVFKALSLYNEIPILMNILNDVKAMSCPI